MGPLAGALGTWGDVCFPQRTSTAWIAS
jgi:hypothetical protein